MTITQEQLDKWYSYKSSKERFIEREEYEREQEQNDEQDEIQEDSTSMEEKLEELDF